ncbi:hypothetical protein [Halorubrum sp. AJ67]|uniref:hypothetical protein n=1 Tax=Halorubrum sp. AJ67 TaxID=1173487 RepID=UPI0003DD2092|nr:hypothetical protein [Halorubrum sp. AJ67]CDK39545.1 uncharacterized protein BN903_97 [Halorubrum sp. AJ67]
MSDRASNAESRTRSAERRRRPTRRAVLVGSALTAGGLSGCLGGAFRDESPTAAVSARSTEPVDDPEHDASVEVDDETARIDGRFAAPVECVALDVNTFTSSPEEGIAIVEVAVTETRNGCKGPAAVEYEGEVAFGFPLRDLTVNHRLDGGEDRVTVARYEQEG